MERDSTLTPPPQRSDTEVTLPLATLTVMDIYNDNNKTYYSKSSATLF